MAQLKRLDGILLLIENTNLHFLLHKLVYKLSLLDWGISSGLFGSYESLNKEDCSLFKIKKICIIIKKLFQSMQGVV